MTPYIRELHTALKRVDPSRPTVALSNQDGELNTITDLIALKQNVGWMRGTTDDVGYWCETLHKSWGNLLAAPCYGVPGYPSQQDDLLGRPTPERTGCPNGGKRGSMRSTPAGSSPIRPSGASGSTRCSISVRRAAPTTATPAAW